MALRLLIAMFVLACATVARAEPYHWLTIGTDQDGRGAFYLDAGRIERNGNVVTARVILIREAAMETGALLFVQTLELDCRGRSITVLGVTSFDREGKELESEGRHPRIRTRRGSAGDIMVSTICGEQRPLAENVDNPIAHAQMMLSGRTADASAGSEQAEDEAQPSGPQQADTQEGVSTGTGFFVGPSGLLLTSYHVVAGASEIAVRTASGQMLPATVHRASPGNDLAVLRVNHRPTRYLSLAPAGSTHIGDRVFTLGYPVIDLLGVGEPRFSDGTVSALSGLGGEDNRMQISVPIQPGNSGGPLLNEAGQVVGVIASQAAVGAFVERTGTLPQSINWAVKAEYASPLIGPAIPTPTRTRSDAIANAREAVVVIVARQDADD